MEIKEFKDLVPMCTKFNDGKPVASYQLTLQALPNHLEPIYYWFLDFLKDLRIGSLKDKKQPAEKIIDNYTASPGSSQYVDFAARMGKAQDDANRMMGSINTVLKSIQQLAFELREYEMRLKIYKDAESKDEKLKKDALLALKQIWRDNVDTKKGPGAINSMVRELGFSTLIEIFTICDSVEEIKKNELSNETIKNILIPRMAEFLTWKDYSQKELQKRFDLQKAYFKAQIENLKLYVKWVKPFLRTAEQLRMQGFENNSALVNAFSTTMMQIVLLGSKEEKGEGKRKMNSVYLIDFKFRGSTSFRSDESKGYAYAHGGKIDITLDCFVLNSEEIELLKKLRDKDDIETGLKFVDENMQTTLDALKKEIEDFASDDKKKEEKKEEKKKNEDDINPFKAILDLIMLPFGITPKKREKKEIEDIKDIAKDDYYEKEARKNAVQSAKDTLFTIYDVFKKSRGLASSPEKFEN